MKLDEKGTGFLIYNDTFEGVTFNLYQACYQAPDRQQMYSRIQQKKLIAYLSFDCILCYLARDTTEKIDQVSAVYAQNLAGVPKIGFSTFSENIHGANVNQTESFLALYIS